MHAAAVLVAALAVALVGVALRLPTPAKARIRGWWARARGVWAELTAQVSVLAPERARPAAPAAALGAAAGTPTGGAAADRGDPPHGATLGAGTAAPPVPEGYFDRHEALITAASHGDAAGVTRILGHHAVDPQDTLDADAPALYFAAAGGHTECVRALVRDRRTDVNYVPLGTWICDGPLAIAVKQNHAGCVAAVLEADGIYVGPVDNWMRLLSVACDRGCADAVDVLMRDPKQRFDVNEKDYNRHSMRSPLHYAAAARQMQARRAVVGGGAEIADACTSNAGGATATVGRTGTTHAMAGAYEVHCPDTVRGIAPCGNPVVQLILARGDEVDVNCRAYDGSTPLLDAAKSYMDCEAAMMRTIAEGGVRPRVPARSTFRSFADLPGQSGHIRHLRAARSAFRQLCLHPRVDLDAVNEDGISARHVILEAACNVHTDAPEVKAIMDLVRSDALAWLCTRQRSAVLMVAKAHCHGKSCGDDGGDHGCAGEDDSMYCGRSGGDGGLPPAGVVRSLPRHLLESVMALV